MAIICENHTPNQDLWSNNIYEQHKFQKKKEVSYFFQKLVSYSTQREEMKNLQGVQKIFEFF